MPIDDIKTSLSRISQSSFVVENPSPRTLGEDVGYSQRTAHPEINFVSDLKSKLETIYREQDLLVQMDLYKRIEDRHFDDEVFCRTRCRLINDRQAVRPDLVIHEDQSNQNNQVLALECKTTPRLSYNDFCVDLFKLMMFKEIFGFEHLVFVIANVSPRVVLDHFERYQEDDFYLNNNHLHILVRESADSPTVCINHPDGNC